MLDESLGRAVTSNDREALIRPVIWSQYRTTGETLTRRDAVGILYRQLDKCTWNAEHQSVKQG